MSEKRFTLVGGKSKFNEILVKVYDNFEEEVIEKQKVVDLLNEQQATIEHLTVEKFKENKRFTKLLSEQQATIRKLQDLCGESDSENAKLRIENKRLQEEIKLLKPTNVEQYEQIVQLQKENEQLRKELGDCEKFRYTVFKRLNKEYTKECSIK